MVRPPYLRNDCAANGPLVSMGEQSWLVVNFIREAYENQPHKAPRRLHLSVFSGRVARCKARIIGMGTLSETANSGKAGNPLRIAGKGSYVQVWE
jgi:hypothetical protein